MKVNLFTSYRDQRESCITESDLSCWNVFSVANAWSPDAKRVLDDPDVSGRSVR